MLTDHPSTETTPERRAATSGLGRALQALTEAAVSTGASEEVPYQAAERAREVSPDVRVPLPGLRQPR